MSEIDAARRCSDAHNLHLHVDPRNHAGKWIAVRLSDGGTDGVLYDKRSDAIRHQLHEQQCAYVCVQPLPMTVQEAFTFLRFNRMAYDAGLRLSDPDKDQELILPTRREDMT